MADEQGEAEAERPTGDERASAATKGLEALGARIQRMITCPSEVGGGLMRFFAPVYRVLGWQAKFGSKKLAALLEALRDPDPAIAEIAFEAATRELGRNVKIAERCVAVSKRVPTAYASWMLRVLDVLRRIDALRVAREGTRRMADADRAALAEMDRTRLLPPLRLDLEGEQRRAGGSASGVPVDEARRKHAEELAKDPQKTRLLELELAAIDQITEAARSETRFLERRRRLLEGARRLLLDAAAALPLDADGVRERERALADQITEVHRLVALGVDPRVSLAFQARSAARRGDRERVYASLTALGSFGRFVGDSALSAKTEKILAKGRFDAGVAGDPAARLRASRERSATEVFGDRVVGEVRRQYARARETEAARADALTGLESATDDAELRRLTLEYLAPGAEDAALAALLTADGCFEVGAALSPVRSREVEEIARLVAHPTREMILTQARTLEDLPGAVIEDPRLILLDLAAGRLLSRRYVERAEKVRDRTHLVGEVRVFLLDASTSMLDEGIEMSRARMRDAILVGELATMLRRLDEPGRKVRLSLFYRFFTKRMGKLHKVSTGSEAIGAMSDFIGRTRTGGTAIHEALVSSFELIRDQKRADPDLSRASIILVTDGNAPVDAAQLRQAREDVGMPINVSVIALGEENHVLRDLVARQRANGERAFYHFVDDDRLASLCRGETLGRSPHLPVIPEPALETHEDRVRATEELSTVLEDTLAELEDLGLTRASGAAPAAPAAPGEEGAKALAEAEHRDRLALERRFLRWFPDASRTPKSAPEVASPEQREQTLGGEGGDTDAVLVLLSTIAEVVGELGGDPFHRQADAIEIMERLLVDARLSPDRYLAVVTARRPRVDAAVAAVHVSVLRAVHAGTARR